MSRRTSRKQYTYELSTTVVVERLGLRSSGAAGVHDDQRTRRVSTGRTNRVGSRSAQRRAAIRSDMS